jgi:hypothetical protein
MKYFLFCFSLLFFLSCNNHNVEYKEANSALDAGREFIDACLKGDFVKADYYMLQDDENKKYLQKIEREYREKDRDGRGQYREASINIAEIDNPKEEITIINYSNSYDKIGHKLKIIEKSNKWLVDFKYTFNPNL